MREIVPYKTVQGARRALDNGGRVSNLFSRSGDDVVDPGELAKAAGVYTMGMRAWLYFEMALAELPSETQPAVVSALSPDLQAAYQANRPRTLVPSRVESEGRAGDPAVVSGYPVFVEDRTQFTGFIFLMVPVVMMIPIFDQFDVYEIFDTPDLRTPRTVIATARGSKRLNSAWMRVGGVLKELHFDDKTEKEHGLYLETMYYTQLAR